MKKASRKNKRAKSYYVPLFWALFAVVIILLFIINLPLIRQTVSATSLGERLGILPPAAGGESGVPAESPAGTPAEEPAPAFNEDAYPSLEDALAHLNDAIVPPESLDVPERPAGAPEQKDAEPKSREQAVYFMRIDPDGTLVRTPVKRQIPYSNSPLTDTLNALLDGTTASENAQGYATFIPQGTALINAVIRENTAALNFNENYMFNSYGAEGYLAQIRQIVWTATEFPNVTQVQFLIEGKRVDFLGDNIRIDRPISRKDLP